MKSKLSFPHFYVMLAIGRSTCSCQIATIDKVNWPNNFASISVYYNLPLECLIVWRRDVCGDEWKVRKREREREREREGESDWVSCWYIVTLNDLQEWFISHRRVLFDIPSTIYFGVFCLPFPMHSLRLSSLFIFSSLTWHFEVQLWLFQNVFFYFLPSTNCCMVLYLNLWTDPCDQIGRVFALLKPLATINLPESLTFLGNFCKGVKINHSSSEIIFGQHLKAFGDFFLVAQHCRWRE